MEKENVTQIITLLAALIGALAAFLLQQQYLVPNSVVLVVAPDGGNIPFLTINNVTDLKVNSPIPITLCVHNLGSQPSGNVSVFIFPQKEFGILNITGFTLSQIPGCGQLPIIFDENASQYINKIPGRYAINVIATCSFCDGSKAFQLDLCIQSPSKFNPSVCYD